MRMHGELISLHQVLSRWLYQVELELSAAGGMRMEMWGIIWRYPSQTGWYHWHHYEREDHIHGSHCYSSKYLNLIADIPG